MLDANSNTLMPIIREKIEPDSIIYTDCWRGYNALDVFEFKHYRINHSHLFADQKNHINGIENLMEFQGNISICLIFVLASITAHAGSETHEELLSTDQKYAESAGHCPSSDGLKKMIMDHKDEINAKSNFSAEIDGVQWKIKNVQTYAPQGTDLEEILKLPIQYNTSKNDKSWCLAQLSKGSSNWMSFHLKR